MEIDYRKEIDPFCGQDPQFLACDGTHLGISAKQMHLEKSIESPDLQFVATPSHKRQDRLFLKNAEARDFLLYLSNECLGYKTTESEEYVSNLQYYKTNLTSEIQKLKRMGVTMMMIAFLNKEPFVLKPVARIFKLLCSSEKSALAALLPFRFHADLLNVCNKFSEGTGASSDLKLVRKLLPEAAQLLSSCKSNNSVSLATNFLQDLVQMTKDLHSKDRPTFNLPEPKKGTYNPTKGSAYYFHHHGCQVRDTPHYEVGTESKSDKDSCRKMYPKVSLGGFGYLFLYFCPIHGHCYGFHLVKGGEGRKDAFFPVTKFKQSPPLEVFYDNACQLSEYALNREPDMWKEVRVSHDIFHSFTHVCGDVFKSTRVQGLEGVNTEICEQFNAFLQCIKYTASKMIQSHFMMYVQFMVYLWNKEKTLTYKDMYHVAVRGCA
jgi:hypothetical protein